MTWQSLHRAWGEFQQARPLIVAPVFTSLPFEVGKDGTTGEVARIIRGMRMVLRRQRAGPARRGAARGHGAGLPQAVQVIGPRYREDLCLGAAAALEDKVGVSTPVDPRSA